MVLAFLSQSAIAAELLVSIGEAKKDELLVQTNFGLREQVYVAKRYRLAAIDFDVLKQPEAEITISAFADILLRIRATNIKGPSSDDQLQEWVGELTSPSNEGVYDIDGRQLPPQIVNFYVRSGPQEVPVKLARENASEQGHKELLIPGGSGNADQTTVGIPLTTLHATIFVQSRGVNVVIQPIADDPRYHLIYEEDPEKVPQGSEALDPENAERLKRRIEFQEKLEKEKLEGAAMDGEPRGYPHRPDIRS